MDLARSLCLETLCHLCTFLARVRFYMATARGELNIHTDRGVHVPGVGVWKEIQTKKELQDHTRSHKERRVRGYCEMCRDRYDGHTAPFIDRLCSGLVMM